MSPELLNPEVFGLKDDCPTKSSDCYALGMVIYEVLSGQVPFAQYRNRLGAATKVLGGGRPERPQGVEGRWFTDDVWRILEHCWRHEPSDRPSVRDVLLHWESLEKVSGSWTLPPPMEGSQPVELSTSL